MDKEELIKLDAELAKREKEIRSQLGEIASPNPSVKGGFEVKIPEYGTDETENANEIADLDRNFALDQQLEAELRQIETTREKIKQGTYGVCSNCSKNINAKRLKAMPVATLCIDCASRKISR